MNAQAYMEPKGTCSVQIWCDLVQKRLQSYLMHSTLHLPLVIYIVQVVTLVHLPPHTPTL